MNKFAYTRQQAARIIIPLGFARFIKIRIHVQKSFNLIAMPVCCNRSYIIYLKTTFICTRE